MLIWLIAITSLVLLVAFLPPSKDKVEFEDPFDKEPLETNTTDKDHTLS